MGRKSGIWLRKQNKTWYVNHGGKQINLGKDKTAAEKQFHMLMAEVQEELVSTDGISAALLLDKFLLWCDDNRAPRTSVRVSRNNGERIFPVATCKFPNRQVVTN